MSSLGMLPGCHARAWLWLAALSYSFKLQGGPLDRCGARHM